MKKSEDNNRHLNFMGDPLPDIAKEDDGRIYTSSAIAILCGAVKQLKELIHQLQEKKIELRILVENMKDN